MAETEREKDLEIQRREASCAKQLAEIKHRLLSLQQSRAQGSLSPAQDLGARGLGDAEAAAAAAAAEGEGSKKKKLTRKEKEKVGCATALPPALRGRV